VTTAEMSVLLFGGDQDDRRLKVSLGRREIELPVTVGARVEIPLAKLQVAVKEVPKAGGLACFETTLRLRRAPQRLVFTVRDEINGERMWQEVAFVP
jgi:hypothetical protein